MLVDRRRLIGAALALPVAGLPAAGEAVGRPAFSFEPTEPGRWRYRSWTWRDAAWRPIVGEVAIESAGLRIGAAPDSRDLAEWNAAIARIRRGSAR